MRILIVDDDEDVCMILELIFKKKGWSVTYCTTGQEALEKLDKEHFDTIFLDIIMPNMSGEELIRKIRANHNWQSIPVIFLTAKEVTQAERAELIGMGAQGIYQKPVDPITVIESASQFLKK